MVKVKLSLNQYRKHMYQVYLNKIPENRMKEAWTYEAYLFKLKDSLKIGYKKLVKESIKKGLM